MRATPFWAEGATEERDLPGHIGDFNRRSWSQTSSCPPAVKDPSPLPAARALTVTPPWARELVSPGPTYEMPHRAVAGRCFVAESPRSWKQSYPQARLPGLQVHRWTLAPSLLRAHGLHRPDK